MNQAGWLRLCDWHLSSAARPGDRVDAGWIEEETGSCQFPGCDRQAVAEYCARDPVADSITADEANNLLRDLAEHTHHLTRKESGRIRGKLQGSGAHSVTVEIRSPNGKMVRVGLLAALFSAVANVGAAFLVTNMGYPQFAVLNGVAAVASVGVAGFYVRHARNHRKKMDADE